MRIAKLSKITKGQCTVTVGTKTYTVYREWAEQNAGLDPDKPTGLWIAYDKSSKTFIPVKTKTRKQMIEFLTK